jgi:F-type H+-transporting ATPase subunit a
MKRRTKKYLYIVLAILAVEIFLSLGIGYQLQIGFEDGKFVVRNVPNPKDIQEQINEKFQRYEFINIADRFPINWSVTKVIIAIDLILILFAILVRRKMSIIPTKVQSVAELVYSMFRDLVQETLGKEKLHYTPYILTIFLFIFLCNITGIFPVPGAIEPTRNLNVPLGMAITVLVVVHYTSIREKGLKNYIKGYTEPFIFMAPLNFISEIAKGISLAFRLFGNILGGAIIVLVISNLIRYILIPVGLQLFFGLFIGTIQAFVFTMLALSYTAVAMK